jgi:predicted DsbA family dithiol-disulfide isomerase
LAKARVTAARIQIDFISDVACPWCAIGLAALEQAIAQVGDAAAVDLRFLPFELNPQMPPGGQDAGEYLQRKYGATPDQQASTRALLAQRGAELGFTFRAEGRGRVYNTFDAHRLLHWAGLQDLASAQHQQWRLKKALLAAYFTHGQPPDAPAVLLQAVTDAGLDAVRAQAILDGGEFAQDVRQQEERSANSGIHAVPTLILNDKYLISGAQPVAVLVQALRQIAAPDAVQT